ncbi:DUF6998 domain-containing protein [Caulobacter endophyticus]|uniref:DUF6998 domain-containing protein n=1 Tax=Caulobacter endophyticus TaxID=2172652 RepID=UPI00240EA91F|nr:hypothetical protein [Caulobacter endophyticus]
MTRIIRLPSELMAFCKAHADLKAHYADSRLAFTLDGKLVGDIAEAAAARAFDLKLCDSKTPGVDAHTRCSARRSVQIKATGLANKGPCFTPGEGVAEHLIFLRIDFARGQAEVAYNGPEAPVRRLLPPAGWTGTKRVSLARVLDADALVVDADRLLRSDGPS